MKYYTPKETALLWGISTQLVRRYCKDGKVPRAILRDGNWLIPESMFRHRVITAPGKRLTTQQTPQGEYSPHPETALAESFHCIMGTARIKAARIRQIR